MMVAREEEFLAQRDLLELQENEIEQLKTEVNLWRDRYHKLDNEVKNKDKALQMKFDDYEDVKKKLEIEKKELIDDITTIKEKFTHLHHEFQKLQAKNLELEVESSHANKKNIQANEMKREIENLRRQNLLLSELYNNVKDQLGRIKKNLISDEIQELECKTLRNELKELKSKYDVLNLQVDNYRGKCFEYENQIGKKNSLINEYKQEIDNINSTFKAQLNVEKQRVIALQKICSRLEQHILSLYGQLGMKEHEQRLRDLKATSSIIFSISSSESSDSEKDLQNLNQFNDECNDNFNDKSSRLSNGNEMK